MPCRAGRKLRPDESSLVTRRIQLLSLAIVLLIAGCSAGPNTIQRDRKLYTDAIARSWQDQMLLNMVKLRYGDALIFLEVSSVINQYSVEGEMRLNAQANTANNGFLNWGATGRYYDRPTITYQPISGEKFSRSMLTPIRPASLLALVQAGWRVDHVFGMAVQAINGVNNRSSSRIIDRQEDPRFQRLLELMHEIQVSGTLAMRIEARPDGDALVMLFLTHDSTEIADNLAEVREILRLNPEATQFDVIYAGAARGDTEIAMLSRSMTEIVLELSQGVEIPDIHVEEGRAIPSDLIRDDSGKIMDTRLHVHAQKDEPIDAQIKVYYRDHWFYIDDRDLQSKRVFSFLIFLFSMAETSDASSGPAVTISAGG